MKKILLIEDNEDVRSNTAEILELSNYEVEVAPDGVTGISKALAIEPDLIICDIMMPALDGYGVLHAVQRNDKTKNTPFIFLTAKTERSDIRQGMEMGADDYITKPFTGTELLNAVSSRLMKADVLSRSFSPDPAGVKELLRLSAGKDLKELTENRNINRYKKKQVVYTEGNHPGWLFYVVKGKIKTYRTNEDGKELVTDLFNVGDFVGHIALLEKSRYKDTAECMEETELALIPKEDIDALIDQNPQVARKFIQMLAKNVSEKEAHLLKLAYDSLRRKVADALLMICAKYRKAMDGEFVIDISRESLATIAGTATESLIRTLSDFKNERVIDINEGKISIVNQRKLENIIS